MNNDNSCVGELGKAGKRRRDDEEETATDRLSHLPEPILYHILSFLDTKLAVQTSALSRYWNRAWKHVPVLNLDKKSFLQDSDQFEKFVSKVLSLRYNLNLRKVVYVDNYNYAGRAYGRKSMDRVSKVTNYALSHGVQHLVLRMRRATNNHCNFGSIFSEYCDEEYYSMFSEHCDNNKKKENGNLTTLELEYFTLDPQFTACSGFPMLTTLNVDHCKLDIDHDLDISTNFPCLENLTMSNCYARKGVERIRVYAPQLLSLTLKGIDSDNVEIFPPKLKFFHLCRHMSAKDLFNSAFLTLERADIELTTSNVPGLNKTQVQQYLNSLFQSLRRAKILTLDSLTIQILNHVSEILEQQSSPFKRLESLFLASDDLHEKVIDYFFKVSSCEKPNILVRSDRLLTVKR